MKQKPRYKTEFKNLTSTSDFNQMSFRDIPDYISPVSTKAFNATSRRAMSKVMRTIALVTEVPDFDES